MSKIVLVTGGRGEIGKGIVKKLIENGYKFFSLDISGNDEKTQNGIYKKVDLCDAEALKLAFEEGMNELEGRLHGWVHAAGTIQVQVLEDLEWEVLESEFTSNIKPIINTLKLILPRARENKGFNIVLISSLFGMETAFGLSPYSLPKNSVIALSKSMALEFGKDMIRTNSICPGLIRTSFTKNFIGKIITENKGSANKFANLPSSYVKIEDLSNIIAALMENKSMNGSNIVIDQGYSIF